MTAAQHPAATAAAIVAAVEQAERGRFTAEDVVRCWGLPHHLAEAVRDMTGAPHTTDQDENRAQGDRLRRAWGHLRRARVELAAGVLPNRQPGVARPLETGAAIADLGLTPGLANALRAIRAASETVQPAVAAVALDEAMAALGSAIDVRDALAKEGV